MRVAGTNHGPDGDDESQKETKLKWKGEKHAKTTYKGTRLITHNHIVDCVPDIFNQTKIIYVQIRCSPQYVDLD